MSKSKVCKSCNKIQINKDLDQLYSTNKLEFMNEHYKLIPILGRNKGNQEMMIDLGRKNAYRLIYYFASYNKVENIAVDEEKAYSQSKNIGLLKLDMNGKTKMILDCPQPYKDGNNYYISHVHILVSNKNMTEWNNTAITIPVICKIKKNDVKKHLRKKDRLIINALPEDYYNKVHIPTSFNLFYKDAMKMTKKQIQTRVTNMIKQSNDLYKYKLKHKLTYLNFPIIVYCHDASCSAGHHLCNELIKSGFTNVIDYADGIVDWIN